MAEKGYTPPYTISDQAVNLIASIMEILTKLTIDDKVSPNPRLRRDSRVRTIHASLAIENNSLSLEQVTDIINGKRVLGAPNEICEVKNAFEAYEHLLQMNPYSQKDLLTAHRILMHDLTAEAGMFRRGGVGVFAGERLVHMAPPAGRVPQLIRELMDWVKKANVHPLIKSCVFHYEFEFIHPFADGNGRMGRMWQTLLLYQWKPVFGWLPIETLIRERQDSYYKALGEADHLADSGVFVDFLLEAIYDALKERERSIQDSAQDNAQDSAQDNVQVALLLEALGEESLSARELMERLQLNHRQSFRKVYLLPALEAGLIEMTVPDKPNSKNQRYRRSGKKSCR